MKKLLAGIVTMGLVLSVGGTTAFAAGAACGRNFIDAGNKGVCGYYNTFCQFVDADGDGICDNCGLGGCSIGYVDVDGDGVCDNYGSGNCGMGAGKGTGYVDADGDGICDNRTTRTPQNGTGLCGRFGGQRGNGRRGR